MDPRKLQRIVVDALDDIKAQDIRVFDTTAQTELFDRVVVATGTSNRQTRALAAHVRDKVRQAGGSVISVEGADTGEWVLVDLGDIVVHVMQPAIRQYYNLEEIWGAKPVRMRIGEAAPSRAAKRASPAAPPAAGTSVKKSTAPAKKSVAPAKRTTAAAKKTTAAAKKPAAATRGTARSTAATAKRPAGKRASND